VFSCLFHQPTRSKLLLSRYFGTFVWITLWEDGAQATRWETGDIVPVVANLPDTFWLSYRGLTLWLLKYFGLCLRKLVWKNGGAEHAAVERFPLSVRVFHVRKVRVKFRLEQAVRERRGTAVLFLYPRRIWRWVVNATPRQFYPRGRHPVPIAQKAVGSMAALDWFGKCGPRQDLIHGREARSESLYLLRYPAYVSFS
jgi:hypothetical protein